jgi:hypothetical protein
MKDVWSKWILYWVFSVFSMRLRAAKRISLGRGDEEEHTCSRAFAARGCLEISLVQSKSQRTLESYNHILQ